MTVAFVVAVAFSVAVILVVLATTGFGHISGISFEGDPHHPPNSSLIAFLGL